MKNILIQDGSGAAHELMIAAHFVLQSVNVRFGLRFRIVREPLNAENCNNADAVIRFFDYDKLNGTIFLPVELYPQLFKFSRLKEHVLRPNVSMVLVIPARDMLKSAVHDSIEYADEGYQLYYLSCSREWDEAIQKIHRSHCPSVPLMKYIPDDAYRNFMYFPYVRKAIIIPVEQMPLFNFLSGLILGSDQLTTFRSGKYYGSCMRLLPALDSAGTVNPLGIFAAIADMLRQNGYVRESDWLRIAVAEALTAVTKDMAVPGVAAVGTNEITVAVRANIERKMRRGTNRPAL